MVELEFDARRIDCDEQGVWLCLRVLDAAAARRFVLQGVKGAMVAALKKITRKRSNDANAYFWVLCGKLAAAARIPKEDIYRDLVRNIGDNFEIFPIRNDAVAKFREAWGDGKLGWVTDIVGPSKITGYTNVCAYYGSSTYNTRQMSALIDLVVQECRMQDIETLTPLELDRLKEEWGCTRKRETQQYQ